MIQVSLVAYTLLQRQPKLSEIKQLVKSLDNYGGEFECTRLNPSIMDNMTPCEKIKAQLNMDLFGNLVAKIPHDFQESLIRNYEYEIQGYLEPKSKQKLEVPSPKLDIIIIDKKNSQGFPRKKLEKY